MDVKIQQLIINQIKIIMGKKGKGNQQQEKHQEPEPEQSEEQEQEGLEDYDEDDLIDQLNPEPSDHDEEVLEKINEEIIKSDDPLKLTWAAIHKLKEEQRQLDEQMEKQMRKIQAKFDLLKVPLIHKIAKVATGKPLEKQIYTHHESTKSLSVNKNKPQAIPGFWSSALGSVSFSQCEQDEDLLNKCTHLEVDVERVGQDMPEEEKIKVVFEFADNDIISNKQLKIAVERKADEFFKKEVTPIKFKAEVSPDSTFAEIFKNEISGERLFELCKFLQTAYNNSVYYYFYGLGQLEAIENEEGAEGEEQDEEEDESEQQDIKPVKKKGNQTKKVDEKKPPLQKPECKNQ